MAFASSEELLGTHTEFRLPSHRRMDIYLQFRNGGLAIENKPWASDQKDQLLDYARYLKSQHTNDQWGLIYLCNGEINEHTLPMNTPTALTEKVTTLDFFQLARWLDDCALHTRAPAVRLFVEALAQFIREHINGELLVENGQELTALILRNEENVKAAFQISQQLHAAKRQIWEEFEVYVREALLRLGAELVFDEALIEGTPHSKIEFDSPPAMPAAHLGRLTSAITKNCISASRPGITRTSKACRRKPSEQRWLRSVPCHPSHLPTGGLGGHTIRGHLAPALCTRIGTLSPMPGLRSKITASRASRLI